MKKLTPDLLRNWHKWLQAKNQKITDNEILSFLDTHYTESKFLQELKEYWKESFNTQDSPPPERGTQDDYDRVAVAMHDTDNEKGARELDKSLRLSFFLDSIIDGMGDKYLLDKNNERIEPDFNTQTFRRDLYRFILSEAGVIDATIQDAIIALETDRRVGNKAQQAYLALGAEYHKGGRKRKCMPDSVPQIS